MWKSFTALTLLTTLAPTATAQPAAPAPREQQERPRIERADLNLNSLVFRRPAQPQKTETVPYCGVSTSPAAPVVTEQLQLTRGFGLVVEFVEPDSPAEQAGVRPYDLLTQLDDQRLTNPEQLRTLVRLRKPGEQAKLTLLRQGKPTTLTVTLGKREEIVADAGADGGGGGINPQGLITFAPAPRAPNDPAPHFEVVPLVAPLGGGALAVARANGQLQTRWSDDQHSLAIITRDGQAARLTVTDRAGKQVFDGPVDTADQRNALPADVAEKLKRAETAAAPRQVRLSVSPAGTRPRVLTSVLKDTLMIARFESGKPTYVLAINTTDGKTLHDGPTITPDQLKSLPDPVATQLDVLEKNQSAASEFGRM